MFSLSQSQYFLISHNFGYFYTAVVLSVLMRLVVFVACNEVKICQPGTKIWALWKTSATLTSSADNVATCLRVLQSTRIRPNWWRVVWGVDPREKWSVIQLCASGATRFAVSEFIVRILFLAWNQSFMCGYVASQRWSVGCCLLGQKSVESLEHGTINGSCVIHEQINYTLNSCYECGIE